MRSFNLLLYRIFISFKINNFHFNHFSSKFYITKGTKLTLQGRPTAREHDGKVYMGIVVNELAFQGGVSQRDTSQQDQGGGYQQPLGADYQGGIDDEIPF